MSVYTDLKKKIKSKKAVIAVMGLGYVGLPIALEFCKKGFTVNGFDTSKHRIETLKKRKSYINDIFPAEVSRAFQGGRFSVTADDKVLSESDVIIVCVPTPLRKVKEPDISYIISAARSLRKRMRSGQLIIVESTTYPGTTREVILPEIQKNGFVPGEDFFLTFSPERIEYSETHRRVYKARDPAR